MDERERWQQWWAGQDSAVIESDIGRVVRTALTEGWLEPPLPGGGNTAARLDRLAWWGRADPVFARLAEGHADAVAIMAELDRPVPADNNDLWAVWAAVPMSVTASRVGGRWRLTGERPWCSGAGTCTKALLTAAVPDGIGLFAIDVADATPVPDTWHAVGMAASDSRTIRLRDVPAERIGDTGSYVDRPGFWHGGIGVAACWYGGALGIADTLLATARRRDLNPHALAHLGAVDRALHEAGSVLRDAAHRIDADPLTPLPRLARQTRLTCEATATEVIDRVGRALGAGPLCQDRTHARKVADLTVYLRQSHAETDLEALGTMTLAEVAPW